MSVLQSGSESPVKTPQFRRLSASSFGSLDGGMVEWPDQPGRPRLELNLSHELSRLTTDMSAATISGSTPAVTSSGWAQVARRPHPSRRAPPTADPPEAFFTEGVPGVSASRLSRTRPPGLANPFTVLDATPDGP
jgi:hypothetical protein